MIGQTIAIIVLLITQVVTFFIWKRAYDERGTKINVYKSMLDNYEQEKRGTVHTLCPNCKTSFLAQHDAATNMFVPKGFKTIAPRGGTGTVIASPSKNTAFAKAFLQHKQKALSDMENIALRQATPAEQKAMDEYMYEAGRKKIKSIDIDDL